MASAMLHLVVLFFLVVQLPPEAAKAPEEQGVSVDLVPPSPVPDAAEKAEEKPSKEKPSEQMPDVKEKGERPQAAPMAFESGADEAREDERTAQPAADAQKPDRQAPLPEPPTARSETSQNRTDAKPALPDVSLPEAETPAQTAGGKSVAVEQPADVKAEKPEVEEKRPPPGKTSTPPETQTVEAKAEQQPPVLDAAREILSPRTLSDPRIRQALGKLPPNRRIVQLCSIEALEQIRRQPTGSFADMLVPYGSSRGLISDTVLDARGGAFRVRTAWYDFDFQCTVDAEVMKVVSFRFAIGAPIPQGDWKARKLPAD